MQIQRSQNYPSDLTDLQWELIKDFIPEARSGGRPRTTCPRAVVDSILYVVRSGCAWRYLPKHFPPWQTVYVYFRQWRDWGVWRLIHQALTQKVRKQAGRSHSPNVVIIDGQSVRAQFGEERGYDGFKKVRGRKRQILVDSLGFIWAAKVHRADQQESTRGPEVLEDFPGELDHPEKVLADSGYGKAPFSTWTQLNWSILPEIKKGERATVRNETWHPRLKIVQSNLKPMRWIVERSFAWFNHSRRLSRDYERRVKSSEAMLFLSQFPMLLSRLAPNPP